MPAPVAVVSASPLLLPALTPQLPADLEDEVHAFRDAAARACGRLAGTPLVTVALGAPAVVDGPSVAFDGLGVAGVARTTESTGHHLVRQLRDRFALDGTDTPLGVDSAVLIHLAPDGAPVLAVQVDAHDGTTLLDALCDVDAPLLLAGDLSPCLDATSPGYVVDGARAWDEAVVDALRTHDLDALRAADDDAVRVRARSWPLPRLAAELAAGRGLALDELTYTDVRGVGRVVASWS